MPVGDVNNPSNEVLSDLNVGLLEDGDGKGGEGFGLQGGITHSKRYALHVQHVEGRLLRADKVDKSGPHLSGDRWTAESHRLMTEVRIPSMGLPDLPVELGDLTGGVGWSS